MAVLTDRSREDARRILCGTWLAFVLAACLALSQPPNPLHVAIAAVAGALLVVAGFSAASRSRDVPAHSASQRTKLAALAASAGAALGLALVSALVLFASHEPALRARFAGRLTEPGWRPWALAFESSILEELTFRLFAMSTTAWLLGRVFGNTRTTWVVALGLSTLLFALAHLPAWLAATHGSLALVGGVLLLNGTGGLLLGWVFWRWGLPYAIICHFFGDVVVQGLGPRLLS